MTGQRQDKTSHRLRERWTKFWQHPRVRSTVRHPLFPLIALVAFCLIVEESYPFSDFPMYSSLSPGSHYFYLTDENDQALPIKALFGISASEMKKMYHSKLTPMAVKRSEKTGERVKASELNDADQTLAGDKLLDDLMPRADDRDWWDENAPKELRLIRVDIYRNDKALREEKQPITVRPMTPKASTASRSEQASGRAYLLTPNSELLPPAA